MTDRQPIWCIMPVLADPVMTMTAIADCLAQTVPTRILVVNQGVDDDFRHRLEQVAEEYSDRVFVWSHQPPLLSLAATWNRALDFVWSADAANSIALIVNNDVRLNRRSIEYLRDAGIYFSALFVSAVGVTEEQFDPNADPYVASFQTTNKGGPDFSCFLISHECHQKYRFDEGFIPAFCVTPDTPVLTSDLRWKPIGELHPGDELIGVDEEDTRSKPGQYRRRCYRPAQITAVHWRLAPCLRITLADGRHVDCSVDHRWLAKYAEPTNTPYQWREAQGLKVGQRIATPLDPWPDPATYDEGWLAAICDGEGTLRLGGRNRCEINIAQKEGIVLDRIRALLTKLGLHYTWRIRPDNNVGIVEIGVRRYALRLLGQMRPVRLLQAMRWDDLSVFSRSAPMDVAIESILHIGPQEVVTIETTTKTYLANGMIAHNCEDLDYHRRLMLAGEGQRIFSVNLPYLHYASSTLKTLPPEQAARIRQQIDHVSRAHYQRKWGGGVNEERYLKPRTVADTDRLGAGDLDLLYDARDDGTATTTALFDREREKWNAGIGAERGNQA